MVKTRILQGDASNLPIPDESIDLIITSPPYFSFREYRDTGKVLNLIGNEEHPWQYRAHLLSWMDEMKRVLKPEGNLFVVIGDKYSGSGGHNNATIGASKERGPSRYSQSTEINPRIEIQRKSRMGIPWAYALDAISNGWVLRDEIIWSKPNSIPTNAKDRCEFTHEYIFHFSLSASHYARPDLWGSEIRKTSVWEISASEGLSYPPEVLESLNTDRHFAAFPAEIPRRVISGWCPDDGVVLDPFGGSGTVSLVARVLNRPSIYVDASSGYVRLAKWRCYVSDHSSRLEARWGKRNST